MSPSGSTQLRHRAARLRVPLAFVFVAVFTLFSLFLARNVPAVKWLLFLMPGAALLMAGVGTREHARYLGGMLLAGAVYAAVLTVTSWLGAQTDLAYLRQVGPYLLLAAILPVLFVGMDGFDSRRLRGPFLTLFAFTALVIAANNFKWWDYDGVGIGSFRLTLRHWTEKYYIYWLILLTWGCIAFLSWRNRLHRGIIVALLSITLVLILTGSRDRAPAIFAVGLLIYGVLALRPIRVRGLEAGVWLLTLGLFFTPWLLPAIDLSKMDARVSDRTMIYRASRELVQQKFWTGHGFGSTRQLEHPGLPPSAKHRYPGGHPHNLALLFWLESGVAGALFLCAGAWFLLRQVVRRVAGRDTLPAVAALVMSFVVMVTFSWSVWYLEILLFHALFAGLVLLAASAVEVHGEEGTGAKKRPEL